MPQTLLISTPMALCTLFGRGMRRGPRPAGAPDGAAPAAPEVSAAPDAGFLRRLPPALGRTLVALQMEDHYVRAHTAKGSTLIFIPLRQAIVEFPPTAGLQTHRSWWVARDAVTGIVRDGRNVRLRLSNGLEAPVSRARVAAVKAAGFLPGQD
ncbi:LytTR family DNA-binding domain-containing protein [Gluconacetobacter tumulisoli]|uniref:LytTR family transcriptional regulator n=1 Tax=Gluconacetobacter tumulisoli TaxID=1286189 RepID=A0A7W4K840_9PROT|nr:LytTR family DNA-binding domain-containing protein [Gluconacetobacter tumulisoli]MBB2202115.1 LytTR family transcriptional regulator [Gluconacetobacter tumulisoli]